MKIITFLLSYVFVTTTAYCLPRLTFSMIMKNEANRKLRECLEEIKSYTQKIDLRIVIIDDASTDNSVQTCYEVFKDSDIPLTIIKNTSSRFSNEIELRQQQWQAAIDTNPEWILTLDADEIFEEKMREEIYNLTNQNVIDIWCFRLYDFWDENHYRSDNLWCAHTNYRAFLIRYRPEFNYRWHETAQHCGRFPKNIYELPYSFSNIRLKHYGWAKKEEREEKYKRYMKLDPTGKHGSLAQYESILDQNPNLIPWVE